LPYEENRKVGAYAPVHPYTLLTSVFLSAGKGPTVGVRGFDPTENDDSLYRNVNSATREV